MNRNILLAAVGLCSITTAVGQDKEKPNFVLFIADDCSHIDLGCYGSVDSKTPNIDRFASESIQFMQGYQAAPMSSPTRHNLYTGVWPVKSGAYPNHTLITNPETETIVQHMRRLGYDVSLYGKSHVAPKEKFDFDSGYDNADYKLVLDRVDVYLDEKKEANENFCMILGSHEPHSPWTLGDRSLFDPDKISLPEMYVDTKLTRENFVNYLAEVNYMDAQFGALLKLLENKGLDDNTIVVFLSEQGNSFPFAKWTLYDMGVKSAYMVRMPNGIQAGTKRNAIVEYVDIVPTFIDLAGGTPSKEIDGKSIKDVLLGKTDTHKKYTFSIQTTRTINSGAPYYGIRSVSDGEYRYIINLTPEMTFENASTRGGKGSGVFQEWKELGKTDEFAKKTSYRYQHRPSGELYNVKIDPYCMHNIIDDKDQKAKVKELDEALRTWMKECGDRGQPTEMDATSHIYPNRAEKYLNNEKKKNAGINKRGKKKN